MGVPFLTGFTVSKWSRSTCGLNMGDAQPTDAERTLGTLIPSLDNLEPQNPEPTVRGGAEPVLTDVGGRCDGSDPSKLVELLVLLANHQGVYRIHLSRALAMIQGSFKGAAHHILARKWSQATPASFKQALVDVCELFTPPGAAEAAMTRLLAIKQADDETIDAFNSRFLTTLAAVSPPPTDAFAHHLYVRGIRDVALQVQVQLATEVANPYDLPGTMRRAANVAHLTASATTPASTPPAVPAPPVTQVPLPAPQPAPVAPLVLPAHAVGSQPGTNGADLTTVVASVMAAVHAARGGWNTSGGRGRSGRGRGRNGRGRGRGRGRQFTFNGTCHGCQEHGHRVADCPHAADF